MSKLEQLTKLYETYKEEFKGQEIVTGYGNENSALLLVGEAPGKDEVRLSKPFVGMAGKNFDEFLKLLGIGRESIYITNAIKYRMSRINPKTGRVVNRPAEKIDILRNRDYILKEIDIINPQYIITLGNVPLRTVTDDQDMSIGNVHGQTRKVSVLDTQYNLFPLYHPASVIYNRSLREVYISDVLKLKNELLNKN